MRRHFVLFIALLHVLSLPSVRGGNGADVGSVPFELEEGLIWGEVLSPGLVDPLRFVLDSGASVTVVDAQTAEDLGLAAGKSITIRGLQGLALAERLKAFSANFGGQKLPTTPLALDLTAINQNCTRRIDGLIGADFLRRHKVQIDYSTHTLRFGNSCEIPTAMAQVIKLKRRNDTWCAPVCIAGNRRQWIRIDTGHDGALAWHPGGREPIRGKSDASLALGHSQASAIAVAMAIGTTNVEGIQTSVLSEPPFEGESGLLGNAFLCHYQVTLDLGRNRLVLDPLR